MQQQFQRLFANKEAFHTEMAAFRRGNPRRGWKKTWKKIMKRKNLHHLESIEEDNLEIRYHRVEEGQQRDCIN